MYKLTIQKDDYSMEITSDSWEKVVEFGNKMVDNDEVDPTESLKLEGWIPWVWSPEKRYPETLDTRIDVLIGDDTDNPLRDEQVRFWFSDQCDEADGSNFYHLCRYDSR